MCSSCRLPVAQTHNFGQLLTFVVLLYQPVLPMRVIYGVLYQTHDVRTSTKIRHERFILSLPSGVNPQFCRIFGLRHLVVSAIGGNVRNLNTGAQLETFPYQTASKSLLYSNAFMAKLGAQSLTFKSVTNRQTKKLNVFGHPGGG